MAQPSNASRTTKVIRVRKQYEFLAKAFVVWLSKQDQAHLWMCESFLQEEYEKAEDKNLCKHIREQKIHASMNQVFSYLRNKGAK